MTPHKSPNETVSNASHVALPLHEHPLLDFESDFSRIAIVPTHAGESPFLEVLGQTRLGRPIHVRGEGGVTRVRLDLPWTSVQKEKWWEGSFWEQGFWEKRFFGKGARVVLHVPASVRARIRSAAARIDVRDLAGCDLSICADAGSITLERIAGRLELATQAGRIDGNDLSGALSVATSAASVRLSILALDPGLHRVTANMGSVRLKLAQGMPVRIDAKTQMGASRVDFPSDRDAKIALEVEADLGSIVIAASESIYRDIGKPAAPPPSSSPYREPAAPFAPSPSAEVELEKILARVADGSLSPAAARDLLRALGWS